MRHASEPRLITMMSRLYSALLHAYPSTFRQTFAQEMTQVFHARCIDAWRQDGYAALWGVWLHTCGDLATTAIQERIEQKMLISRITLIRLSGLATIAGGVIYLVAPLAGILARKAGLGPLYVNYFPIFACCSLLGLIGVIAIQRTRMGQVAASITLLGAFSGIALLTLNSILLTAYPWYALMLVGYGMSGLLCLGGSVATGIIMRQTRPLARRNGIVLVMIGWLIFQTAAYVLVGRLTNYQAALLLEFTTNYLVGCILWCVAGWEMWRIQIARAEERGVSHAA